MRKKNKIIASLVIGLFVSGCSHDLIPPQRNNYFSHESVENYTSSSDLVMNGTNVSNNLRVNGDFYGSNSHFKHVDLNGNSKLANSVVTGIFNVNGRTKLDKVSVLDNLNVSGDILITHSWIKKPFEVRGKHVKLYNSWVKDIIVKDSKYDTVIEVHGGTQVKGNIVFASGRGKVYIDKDSRVHGSIIGGEKEREQEMDVTLG